MGVMDCFNGGERGKDSLCRYDSRAAMKTYSMLIEAGASDAMIKVMSEQEAQKLLMADNESQIEILEDIKSRCEEPASGGEHKDSARYQEALQSVGSVAIKGS